MKYKLCILLFVLVSLLETYFRETDPTNPFRPTVVLSWLQGYTSLVSPWLQDGIAVVHGVGDLLLSPLKGLVEYVAEEASKRPPEQVFLLVYISVWFVLGVYVTVERDARRVQQAEDTPKLHQEGGKMLKLQAEKTRLEAEVDRLLKEEDDLKTKKEEEKGTGTNMVTASMLKAKQKQLEAETKLLVAQKAQQERKQIWTGKEKEKATMTPIFTSSEMDRL